MSLQVQRHAASSSVEGTTRNSSQEVQEVPALPILKSLEIQPVSQLNLREKNVVWLSPDDYTQLFGNTDATEPRFVKIADQVFRAGLAAMDQGRIGMTDIQMDSVGDGIYSTKNFRGVSLSPYDPSQHIPYTIGNLEIEIDDEKSLYHEDDQRTINLDQVRDSVRKALENEVITRGKSLTLSLPQGTFKVKINTIHPAGRQEIPTNSYGILLPDTQFTIVPRLSPHVMMTDQVYKEEVLRMDFQLSIAKRSVFASSDTLPLSISSEEIKEEIYKRYHNRVIAQGAEFTLHLPSGWDLTVKFKEGVLPPSVDQQNLQLIDYSDGFVLSRETPFRLLAPSTVLLTEGKPNPARRIDFKIADMPGKQTVAIDHEKERWICLDDLKQTIAKMDRPFTVGEIFEVALSSGNYYIEVKKALGSGSDDEWKRMGTEPLWAINGETDMRFAVEKELHVNMVRDHKVHPLKRATIQVKSERVPDDGLKITLDQLKETALRQAPERLVDNHRFSVVTNEKDRLELQVVRTVFDDSVPRTEEVSAFGRLDGATEIDFSATAAENLTLIENVHSDDLKAMRFSMRVTKQENTAKHERPPIVVRREELTAMIRKELAKYPYITEGFKKTFELENGWNVEVTFRKGILDKAAQGNHGKKVKSSESLKDAFAIGMETEIQLVGGGSLISLCQGEPVPAGRMHIEVVDVKEDFTTQDSLLSSGAWINMDELKTELLKRNKPLVSGEKMLVELESGRYIVEIKSAKPSDPAAQLPKKRREAIWSLTDETKLNVTIDEGVDLISVNDSKVHPLKKIKFISYPAKSGQHISIKEEELREALMEQLPDRLIHGQILELETRSNHTVCVKIEEVTFEDDTSSIDKEKVFSGITPDTEIQFRGKDKSNIAISAQPKVLEVDDPIKYLEDLGMAGIDKEFEQVFRIFYSRSDRLFEEARRRGTKPIKGILLWGPPGTGKTTLARHVGEMLGCSGERLQLITATEVFNMWFGQSEENIRKLFEAAKAAQKKYGEDSPLYIVIVDEIDALLPQRGGSVNKVRDTLVNQFLGEMDGLNELNNLLVIGLTNRKDEIDPAALRHGRLGVHIEIGLPDRKARRKIFDIHTRKLVKEGLLHPDVNLDALAEQTDKMPGAAIEGIVETASLFSLARLSKLKCSKEELRVHPDGMVTMEDFNKAMKEQNKEKQIPDSVRHLYI